eukprot:4325346-Alexandrium_andersonii.AAC.1
MTIEFAGLPLMEASFRGGTVYAPVPKNADQKAEEAAKKAAGDAAPARTTTANSSRAMYDAYLADAGVGEAVSFLDWAAAHSRQGDGAGRQGVLGDQEARRARRRHAQGALRAR